MHELFALEEHVRHEESQSVQTLINLIVSGK
jgi:hypothetical protein